MMSTTRPRDYRLAGNTDAREFRHADWYCTPVPRKQLKQLMRRADQPALTNYGLWLASIFLTGALLIMTWGSAWAVPAAILYGVLYGSGADSRWHECGHGTPFRTHWLNEGFYQLASFMCWRNPHLWRWSHTRHHSDTMIVGRDPEIAFPRPPNLTRWLLNLLYIPTVYGEFIKMIRLSFGRLSEDEKTYLDKSQWQKAFRASRIHLAILGCTVLVSLAVSSLLPLMLVGLPTLYGSWLHHLMATTQHAGLAEDVPDHRMNSRTVYMNPFFRFIYSNMNYHIEHHMYPMVPYHALPALHEAIRHDTPAAYPSLWAAYREILPAMIRQQQDTAHYVTRELPPGAGTSPTLPAGVA